VVKFILKALFQSAQHFYEKREGSGAGQWIRFREAQNMRIRIRNTARKAKKSIILLVLWIRKHFDWSDPEPVLSDPRPLPTLLLTQILFKFLSLRWSILPMFPLKIFKSLKSHAAALVHPFTVH
jgi:hypothetical protein